MEDGARQRPAETSDTYVTFNRVRSHPLNRRCVSGNTMLLKCCTFLNNLLRREQYNVLAVPPLNSFIGQNQWSDWIEQNEPAPLKQGPPVTWPLFIDVVNTTLSRKGCGKQH